MKQLNNNLINKGYLSSLGQLAEKKYFIINVHGRLSYFCCGSRFKHQSFVLGHLPLPTLNPSWSWLLLYTPIIGESAESSY